MLATDGNGVPLTGILASASTSEFNLILPTIDTLAIHKRPMHPITKTKILIADKGYDAGWVRTKLRERGITPYIPKRRKPREQEEPSYNRRIKPHYATRWVVERTFSWLGNYRRILIRWEKNITLYRGFFKLACALICLQMVLK